MFSLLFLVGCVDPDAPVVPGDDAPFVFEVPKGASASRLGPALVDAGLVSGEWGWKLYLRQADLGCLKAGRFQVRRSMSLNELRTTLCGVPLAEEVPFTVVEGMRIRDIDDALVATGRMQAGTYTTLATSKGVDLPFDVPFATLEGFLYPETYAIPATGEIDAKRLIERQLALFQERFLSKHTDFGKRTLAEVVIMASMLEREEPKPSQRPMVAGILWKRIDNGWNLGVDATSRYTLDKWNDRKAFLGKLRDPDDPYNSRLRPGLPPGPIGNPSLESLEAALQPVASEFWYYLHDGTGTLRPARDAAGHEANRKRYDVY